MNTELNVRTQQPTGAFVFASWVALLVGTLTYMAGLWNAEMQLNEKGYYFALLLYGLFAAVSLQKSVRDKAEGIPVTGLYMGLCWLSPDGHPKLPHLWPVKLLQARLPDYDVSGLRAMRAAASLSR